ncbi:MAG: N-acetylmuramoyl-L-alanine amidase [Clostridium sp.]
MYKILIIDVGHGGTDSGACANGIVEKVANLNTALALKAAAEAMGIMVFIIRDTDTTQSLDYRVKYANDVASKYPGAQILFVSVHHNAGGGDRAETIHSIHRGEGQRAANLIVDELQTHLGQQKKVYEKVGSDNKDYYYVIKYTNMDAIIVEIAFLDNINDVKICDSVEEQQSNGQVIACAIGKFFGVIKDCDRDNEGTTPAPKLEIDEMSFEGEQEADSKITVYAHSTDPDVYYKYFHELNGEWTTVTDWQESNNCSFMARNKGTYKVVCHVKYKSNTTDNEDAYNFTIIDIKDKHSIYNMKVNGSYYGETYFKDIAAAVEKEMDNGVKEITLIKK